MLRRILFIAVFAAGAVQAHGINNFSQAKAAAAK
ncbi:TPA: deoxyribonuclease I, partial [Serratia marcescens]